VQKAFIRMTTIRCRVHEGRSLPTTNLRCGYTLLEVLAVLFILTMTMSAMVKLHEPSDHLRLQVTCEEISSILARARSRAMSEGVSSSVLVDVERNTVLLGATEITKIPSSIEINLIVARVGSKQTPRGTFYFFADGSSTGGEIKLRLNDKLSSITINWLTGQVIIHDA